MTDPSAARDPSGASAPVVINTGGDTDGLQFVEFAFRQVQFAGKHAYAEMADVYRHFDIDEIFDDTWTIHRRVHWDDFGAVVAERNNIWVFVRKVASPRIECAADTPERAKCTIDALLARIPLDSRLFEANSTSVTMWNSIGMGRALGVPKHLRGTPWCEVRGHFSAPVASSLERVLAIDSGGPKIGRLMLWHGAPGTGKTSAILALIHEWRDWCSIHSILDPDRFFGNPGYLTEVLSSGHPGKWKLIIAEDCDQYLAPPPGSGVGGPLSQLLNLTDGLLGQGSNTMVLLTTNAPIQRVHPALIRPGRCLSNIEFTNLTGAEAARLTGNPAAPSMTLADAFQYLATGELAAASEPVGGYV